MEYVSREYKCRRADLQTYIQPTSFLPHIYTHGRSLCCDCHCVQKLKEKKRRLWCLDTVCKFDFCLISNVSTHFNADLFLHLKEITVITHLRGLRTRALLPVISPLWILNFQLKPHKKLEEVFYNMDNGLAYAQRQKKKSIYI